MHCHSKLGNAINVNNMFIYAVECTLSNAASQQIIGNLFICLLQKLKIKKQQQTVQTL